MPKGNPDRRVRVVVGDVIDMRDTDVTQTKAGQRNTHIIIRSEDGRRRIQLWAQEEAHNWLKARVLYFTKVSLYPRCVKGKWYNEMDVEVVLENAPDAEVTLVSKNHFEFDIKPQAQEEAETDFKF